MVASTPPVCYILDSSIMLDTKAKQDRMPLSVLSTNLFPPIAVSSPQRYSVPTRKPSCSPISVLCSKVYPRNINGMQPIGTSFRAPTVIFFACLDLEHEPPDRDGHHFAALKPGDRFSSEAPPSAIRWSGSPEITHDLQEVR